MSTIDANLLFTLIAASVTAFLGFLVFLHNRESVSSKIFIAHSFTGVIWAITNYFSLIAPLDQALFWIRGVIFLAVPYVLLFFAFIIIFPGEHINRKEKRTLLVTLTLGLLLCVLAISPFIFRTVILEGDAVVPIVGSAISLFGAVLVGFLVISGITVIKNYIQSNTADRIKYQWLSIGFGLLLSFTLLIFFVLLRVALFKDTTYVMYSPLFVLPIFAGTAYAILRHRLFNIKVIATETFVFSLLVTSFFGSIIAPSQLARILGIAVTVAILFIGIYLVKSVLREVEQREKLEKLTSDLELANQKLKELDTQKSQFLSFASHDLKSPLNIIKQFATLIADGTYKEPAKVQETIAKIKSTADRATTLVDDFLDIRRIEEGHMDYAYEARDIVSFVRGITEDYATLAKGQKGIEMTFSSALQAANVKMDTTRLRQVIQNLLSNSLKYTEKGWIKVSITDEQKSILIAVTDSGIGMDKQLVPILFEQFRRDPGVAKKIQGTGLGLYISKQIVIAHGGQVWAESEGKGLGSSFFVRLPKA